ncbi:MAG: AAA family ATPase, partial [Candidatus Thiodiazotropha sp.]
MATDSIYVKKTPLCKLEGVRTFKPHEVHPKGYCRTCLTCHDKATPGPPRDGIAPAQWRDKVNSSTCHCGMRSTSPTLSIEQVSTTPRYDDPLTRHQLSYLNGGGGSGKTTRAIELFREKNPLVFTPTHHLAKEMRARGAKAQTYHSFFRWSGQTEWTQERMGQKYIPCVIIRDGVCTVPQPILETFLGWLDGRGVQVVCCGDQGQPPPIAGEMPHDWLRRRAD